MAEVAEAGEDHREAMLVGRRDRQVILGLPGNPASAFVTGTLGGVTPVVRVDGRQIGTGRPGPMTSRASDLYLAAVMPSSSRVSQFLLVLLLVL